LTDAAKPKLFDHVSTFARSYEKMISGMYLGEIVRRVLLQLAKGGFILDGSLPDALFKPGKFETSYVSLIEG